MAQSKTDYAYKIIKEKILSGEMAPASSISEETLQAELKISRTPIREALRTLKKESFVEIYPRKGIIVAPISLDLLRDIYDVRLAIEPIVTSRACGKIPRETLLKFKNQLTCPPKSITDERELSLYYNTLDADFHQALQQYAQNRFFTESMSLVSDHERRIRNMTFNSATNDMVIQEHLSMIDALLEGDADKLAQLATDHVRNAREKAFRRILDF
ncbi:MAG: GntR family transcriptional regulator [Lawsonibacter sp.]|nr:GntR family transcriptional regulator [Lawsonibacter sp.]